MKLIYLTALLMFFTNIWCPKGILFPFVYVWQRIGLKGWILLEIPIIIQSKQFITKQFTHLLKISFCKNCRKHKQKRSWKKGNNKNYEITVFSTGVKTWLVCVARGWQQWQTQTSVGIIHQATASQELHLWSWSFWAPGLSRGCVEWTQWKDETENKTKHIPGQVFSHPPGRIRPPFWATFCGWGTLQWLQWKSWADTLYELSFQQLLLKLCSPVSSNLFVQTCWISEENQYQSLTSQEVGFPWDVHSEN